MLLTEYNLKRFALKKTQWLLWSLNSIGYDWIAVGVFKDSWKGVALSSACSAFLQVMMVYLQSFTTFQIRRDLCELAWKYLPPSLYTYHWPLVEQVLWSHCRLALWHVLHGHSTTPSSHALSPEVFVMQMNSTKLWIL